MDGDELDRILTGGRERRPIVVAESDPARPERFAGERERIRQALGPLAIRRRGEGGVSRRAARSRDEPGPALRPG